MTRTARRARRHAPMAMYHVDVAAVRELTPAMRRITLAGPSLTAFADDGPDQRCKLFLPRPGSTGRRSPAVTAGTAHWLALPDGERPVMRTYTVRHARPEQGELDIDIVLHGDAGPGTAWARRAAPGDRVAMFGAYAEYDPPPDTRWQLLVGDETALPAIAAACERLPAGTRATVVVEVAGPAEEQPLAGDVAVTWVHRGRQHLAAALRGLHLPRTTGGYAWVGGEASSVKAARRQLLAEHGLHRDRVTFMGYWKRGGAVDPAMTTDTVRAHQAAERAGYTPARGARPRPRGARPRRWPRPRRRGRGARRGVRPQHRGRHASRSRSARSGTPCSAGHRLRPSEDVQIVLDLRLPRTLIGLAAGVALGLAGALMQALTRNPLADPGILGINAGAATAVVLAIRVLGVASLTGYIWFAFAGAAGAFVVVYLLGTRGRSGASPERLALAGAAVGAALLAVTNAVALLDVTTFDRYRLWTVGALAGRDLDVLCGVLPFIVIGSLLALGLGPSLNVDRARRRHRPRARRQPEPHPGAQRDLGHPAVRGGHRGGRPDRLRRAGRAARRPHARRTGPALAAAVLAGPGARPCCCSPTCRPGGRPPGRAAGRHRHRVHRRPRVPRRDPRRRIVPL